MTGAYCGNSSKCYFSFDPDRPEENLPESNIEKNVHDDINLEIFTNSQKAQQIVQQAQMMEKANNPN